MPSTATKLCKAQASYKKTAGLLELTSTHLQWTPVGKQAPTVRVPNAQAASLLVSKEGSAQVKLKLGLVGDDAGHTFQFTNRATAVAEREAFKTELTNIIANNRNAGATSEPGTSSTRIPPPNVATPRPSVATSRAASVSSNGRASSSAPSGPADDFLTRKNVLLKNPELGDLHRQLVMTGQITEKEFWEGREHLLLAEAAQVSQQRGRPGKLVDPRPETTPGGDLKIMITPQLVADLFDEYPVVAKAYSETVPKELSEEEFWTRYFQSKLFSSHRASIRTSATQHVVKDDPIFDKYVEKEDDDLEPQRQPAGDVEMLIDLRATEEDHVQSGNQKDITMQPGKQRGTLPLIRRFNEHSERLLNTAMGGPPNKKRRLDGEGHSSSDYISQIDLDDLHDPESSAGIILEMQDRNRYFEAGAGSSGTDAADEEIDVKIAFHDLRLQFGGWTETLKTLKPNKKANDDALARMTQNVQGRLEVKLRKSDIPDAFFRQMTTCQTAASEFLRQFWSAIYAPASELQMLSAPTPAQKAAKAAKMAGYLGTTREKVDAIVQAARGEGLDPQRIRMESCLALKPTLDAVDVALRFYQSRKK